VFARHGVLTAQRFDAAALQLQGEPVSLGDQPGVAPAPATYEAGPYVSASANGTLAYYLPIPAATSVQWMNAEGRALATLDLPAGRYTGLALSPDDTRAVLVRAEPGIGSSLWLVDLPRAGVVPLVTEGRNTSPVWSPDGTRVAFASDRGGQHGFYIKTATDAAAERQIAVFADRTPEPRGWTHDGTWLLFNRVDPRTRWNVYRLRASGAGEPELLIGGPAIEAGARSSPDDRWLAYFSDEGGRIDAFVRSVDPSGPKVQVSTGGVQFAFWTRDARQMLFLKRDRTLWRVPTDLTGAAPRVGATQQLGTFPPGLVAMDLARDGRFLAIVAERSDAGAVTVVQAWQTRATPP
jgi:Tol biopolymer transport system component